MVERDETLREALKYLERRCDDFIDTGMCIWSCSKCRVNKRYEELLGISLVEVSKWTEKMLE